MKKLLESHDVEVEVRTGVPNVEVDRSDGYTHVYVPEGLTLREAAHSAVIELSRDIFMLGRGTTEWPSGLEKDRIRVDTIPLRNSYFTPYSGELQIIAMNMIAPVDFLTRHVYENIDDKGKIDFGVLAQDFGVEAKYCCDWCIMNSLLRVDIYGSHFEKKRGMDGSGRADVRRK